MRSVKQVCLPAVARILIGIVPFVISITGHTDEDGYRLLELDGYKVKWGDRQLGVGASISYAFVEQTMRFDDAINCRDMAPVVGLLDESLSMDTLRLETMAAFRVWEQAAGVQFHETENAENADIVIGAQGRPRGRAFANVTYSPESHEGVRTIQQALICLNPDHLWKVGFDGDENVYDLRYTLVHEIGHAIGLDHPGPHGQVMAFRYTEAFADLQPGDLRGVQMLYGQAANLGEPARGYITRLASRAAEMNNDQSELVIATFDSRADKANGSSGELTIALDNNLLSVVLDTAPAIGELGIGEEKVALSLESLKQLPNLTEEVR